jgi:hypothetical protein
MRQQYATMTTEITLTQKQLDEVGQRIANSLKAGTVKHEADGAMTIYQGPNSEWFKRRDVLEDRMVELKSQQNGLESARSFRPPSGRTVYHELIFSAAIHRRSRCGSVRCWPVVSRHFSPGAAPQVGQVTASICSGLSSVFMAEGQYPKPVPGVGALAHKEVYGNDSGQRFEL